MHIADGDHRDVIIVGGGFGGSLLALSLARRGVRVSVIDPHRVYGSDFRCEKFNPEQAGLLAELGTLDCLCPEAGGSAEIVVSRGYRYEQMVNRIRGAWPSEIAFHEGSADAIELGEEAQKVVLSSGEALSGRLAVLATGRGERLRRSLGIQRQVLRKQHSLCIGFTLTSAEAALPFDGMIQHGERAGDGIAFVSLFPMDGAMRVNLFSYRDPKGAWARGFRDDPLGSLTRTFPKLAPLLAGAQAAGPAEFGVTDLYEAQGHVRAGVLMVGDAFSSSCPATGMGITRILTDVRQLSGVHVPAWLATTGMPAGKIAEFYSDPVKQALERRSRRSAQAGRSAATRVDLRWRAYRLLRSARRAVRASPLRSAPTTAGAHA